MLKKYLAIYQMHMKKKNINQWLIYLALFGLGVTIGDCIDFGYFELDNSISVIDALTLFITVGLTWYIATILDRQTKNEQQETDLIVDQIKDVSELLKEINDIIRIESSYNEVNLKIHCIGLAKQNLFEFLKNNYNKNSVDSFEMTFKDRQRKLKDLLTNTPIDKNDLSKISIKKGVVKYTDERIKEIVTEIYSFRTELFKLQLFVTKK